MFTLTFPFQVVNLQDSDAFVRFHFLLLFFCGQQQENAATQEFMVFTTFFSNLGQGKIDRFEVLLSVTTI
jgi:hypothetical protein